MSRPLPLWILLGPVARAWLVMVVSASLIGQAAQAAGPQHGVWRTRGFDEFRAGTFSNAGENLYVSRAGVLQRIHQFDFNRDGWFDLVMCNSQDLGERAPAYVYADPLVALRADRLARIGPTGGDDSRRLSFFVGEIPGRPSAFSGTAYAAPEIASKLKVKV